MPSPSSGPSPFDFLAEAYDAWFEEEEGRLIFASEVAALQTLLPGLPRPWVEIGVGSGRFAQALQIDLGLDPAPRLLELARRRGIQVVQGFGEKTPFPDAAFGAAFLIVTLCFVPSPLEVLREVWRILKPNGQVVVGFVPRGSPWGELYEAKKAAGHRFYRHARLLTLNELQDLLSQAGFALPHHLSSTLFQPPGQVQGQEAPREGFFPQAGFVALAAQKKAGNA